jgi:outer membrane protein TolC
MNKIILGALIVFFSLNGQAIDLPEYLQAVLSRNKTAQSYDASVEAARDRRIASDIELVPIFTTGVGYQKDQSPLGQFAQLGAVETESQSFNLGLAKKFSTGTSVNLIATASEIENSGSFSVPSYAQFSYGTFGVGLSQSLWKDAFGSGTRMRWQRLDASSEAEVGQFDLQKKLLLVDAETVYWDYIYNLESLRSSLQSLERAKRIENWTRRRVGDGIGDRADLFSTQALVAARQLQVISAEDELAAAKRKLRDYLELSDAEAFPEITGNISQSRHLTGMIDRKQGRIVSAEAYLMSLKAKAMSAVSAETDNSLRPDVVLSGSYNTNNFQSGESINTASQNWGDSDRPTWKVGLSLVYIFDTEVKSSTRAAARKDAQAAKLLSERKILESESAWIELNRRYSEMSKRIEAATQVSQLQMSAAKAQTDLFNKGRSVTANVINAEEDAATAELTLIKLKAEQRKMEAQGRLFVVLED